MFYKKIKSENIQTAKLLKEAGWKAVKDFEQYYLVSESGDVFSIVAGKIKAPYKTRRGYLEVVLYKPGCQPKHKKVHRLVGEAFKKRPPGKDIIHHNDHNKLNNHKSNLIWETTRGNARRFHRFKQIVAMRNRPTQKVA
jgi:hypothetical protein